MARPHLLQYSNAALNSPKDSAIDKFSGLMLAFVLRSFARLGFLDHFLG